MLRVRRQTESATELAKRLEAHPAVQVVRYPGPRRPALSFDVAGADEARHVETSLRLITNATSLGGMHSLLECKGPVGSEAVFRPGSSASAQDFKPVDDI